MLLEVHLESRQHKITKCQGGGRGGLGCWQRGFGRGTNLFAEGLVHLREQGELHEGHAAQSEEERDLSHGLVHGDQVVP